MAIKFIGNDERGIAFVKHELLPPESGRVSVSGNSAGVTVTKDLACIAVSGETVEIFMYTFTDGRAFRSVPYFNRWRPEFVLHDNDLEDGAFGRALMDICEKFGICSIGYDPAFVVGLYCRADL